jgi:bacterioferritin-associated ferredoxin
MLPDTVQEILTTLRDLEQQETLLVEANCGACLCP